MSVRFSRGRRSPRKMLVDMTNLQLNGELLVDNTKPATNTSTALSFENECYDQLLKENMTLKKLISDRNKIVELARVELRNMKGTLQKFQLQNWNLAQANIQIAAELNSSRVQLKSIHHQLACKDALLRSKCPEVQEYRAATKRSLQEEDNMKEACEFSKKRAFGRSRSAGAAIFEESCEDEREQRRWAKRRKTVLANNGVKDVEKEGELRNRRLSMVVRPQRRAAEKVQSYKERSVNVKLRRKE